MKSALNKTAKSVAEVFYLIFRVIVGLLFAFHGMQKLGWLDGLLAKPFAIAGFAGAMGLPVWLAYFVALVELVGGILLILGLWTRIVSIITGIQMIVALAIAHFPNGWFPMANGGELAVLYLMTFFVMFAFGARKYSLDAVM